MNERASFLCDTAGQTVTVYIRGEIDHHTAVTVRNGIDAMLFEKRPAKMILDLSGVGFMDSSGLGLIMGRLSVMRSLGGEMAVRNPSRETESILRLAGMERLIPIEYSEGHGEEPPAPVKKSYVKPEAVTAPRRHARAASGEGQAPSRRPSGKRVRKPETPA